MRNAQKQHILSKADAIDDAALASAEPASKAGAAMWNTTKHLSSSTHESSRPSALPPPSSSSGCSGADYDGSLGALLEEWADFTPLNLQGFVRTNSSTQDL